MSPYERPFRSGPGSQGRAFGKVWAQEKDVQWLVDKGEHVHTLSARKPEVCHNGATFDCLTWKKQQEEKNAARD